MMLDLVSSAIKQFLFLRSPNLKPRVHYEDLHKKRRTLVQLVIARLMDEILKSFDNRDSIERVGSDFFIHCK